MTTTSDHGFGRVGLWITRALGAAAIAEASAAAEQRGYGAIWVSGGSKPGALDDVRIAIEATERVPVGTSVFNIWAETAEEAAAGFAELEAAAPGRAYLGLGVSHGPLVERNDLGRYEKPLTRMREYLDGLDAAAAPVPAERRLIGALGPKMLGLARERTLGALPYLMTEHLVATARDILGPDAFLAPELTVALHENHQSALDLARGHLATYLSLPNYTGNFARSGFGAEHLEDGGSDELLEAVYAIGTPERIAARIDAYLRAGADHVNLQFVVGEGRALPELIAAIDPGRSGQSA